MKINFKNEFAQSYLKTQRHSIDDQEKPAKDHIKNNKLAVQNSNFIHHNTDLSTQSITNPIGIKVMKNDRSVFSNNGSMATSLTNITKSKLETKENTLESKELVRIKLKEKGVMKRNLMIQVNNQNSS